MMTERTAFVTCTTPAFVPGTVVLVHSFLAHHPDFVGEVIVLHDGLSDAAQARLSALPRTTLRPASDALRDRIEALVEAVPAKGSVRGRYLSLDVLALGGYDRVLFCDSDVLVRGPLDGLFEISADLVCCGDGPYYTGRGRDPETFRAAAPGTASPLRDTFNAGVLLFGPGVLGAERHRRALDLIRPAVVARGVHNDQVVFYHVFAGRQRFASATYNVLLGHHLKIGLAEGVGLDDARLVHFNGPRKPWARRAMPSDPVVARATAWWREAATEAGVEVHALPSA